MAFRMPERDPWQPQDLRGVITGLAGGGARQQAAHACGDSRANRACDSLESMGVSFQLWKQEKLCKLWLVDECKGPPSNSPARLPSRTDSNVQKLLGIQSEVSRTEPVGEGAIGLVSTARKSLQGPATTWSPDQSWKPLKRALESQEARKALRTSLLPPENRRAHLWRKWATEKDRRIIPPNVILRQSRVRKRMTFLQPMPARHSHPQNLRETEPMILQHEPNEVKEITEDSKEWHNSELVHLGEAVPVVGDEEKKSS